MKLSSGKGILKIGSRNEYFKEIMNYSFNNPKGIWIPVWFL